MLLDVTIDDHSRVLLNEISDDPGSDYINANFIDVSWKKSYVLMTVGATSDQLSPPQGYRTNNFFIAAQGKFCSKGVACMRILLPWQYISWQAL